MLVTALVHDLSATPPKCLGFKKTLEYSPPFCATQHDQILSIGKTPLGQLPKPTTNYPVE